MKILLPLFALFAFSTALSAQDKATLRKIAEAFDAIEADYESWPHYSCSAQNLPGENAWQHNVWKSDGDGGYIKVEAIKIDEVSENKLQFFFKGSDLLFTLDRTETTLNQEKAPTTVEERRYYYANNQLVRLLEKKGEFPSGKKVDTESLKNRELPLSGDQSPREIYVEHHELAAQVIERARHLENESESEAAPSNAADPEARAYRVIRRTASPEAVYAVAWGLKGKTGPQGEQAADGTYSVDSEDPNIVNYLVNVRTGATLGTLKGKHFGDKAYYHQYENQVAWSDDSRFVVQFTTMRWSSENAFVYEVIDGERVSAGTDLKAAAVKAALKEVPNAKDFEITIRNVQMVDVGDEWVLKAQVSGMVPKGEGGFEVQVTFGLSSGKNDGGPMLKWQSTDKL